MKYYFSTRSSSSPTRFYHLLLHLKLSPAHLRRIVHACLIFSNFSRLLKKLRMKIYSSSATRERLRNDISKVPLDKVLKKLLGH